MADASDSDHDISSGRLGCVI